MKSKSTTQKLNIRWQDRSWWPRIESHDGSRAELTDEVAIYKTADRSASPDIQLVVRHRRVVQRTILSFKQPWNN